MQNLTEMADASAIQTDHIDTSGETPRSHLRFVTVAELQIARLEPEAERQGANRWYRAGHRLGVKMGQRMHRTNRQRQRPDTAPRHGSARIAPPDLRNAASPLHLVQPAPAKHASQSTPMHPTAIDLLSAISGFGTEALHRAGQCSAPVLAVTGLAGAVLLRPNDDTRARAIELLHLVRETGERLVHLLAPSRRRLALRGTLALAVALELYNLTGVLRRARRNGRPRSAITIEVLGAAIPAFCSIIGPMIPMPWALAPVAASLALPFALGWMFGVPIVGPGAGPVALPA